MSARPAPPFVVLLKSEETQHPPQPATTPPPITQSASIVCDRARSHNCRFTAVGPSVCGQQCLSDGGYRLRWRRAETKRSALHRDSTTVEACSAQQVPCACQRHSHNAVRDSGPSPSPERGRYPARRLIRFTRRSERIGLAIHECSRARQRVRRFHAGHQVIERRAECIEIAARVGSQSLNLFERRVVWRVAEDACRVVSRARSLRLTFGQTEIEQNDLAARVSFRFCGLMSRWTICGSCVCR